MKYMNTMIFRVSMVLLVAVALGFQPAIAEASSACSASYEASLGTLPHSQGWTPLDPGADQSATIMSEGGVSFLRIVDNSTARGIRTEYPSVNSLLPDQDWNLTMKARINSSEENGYVVGMNMLLSSPGGKYASIYIDTDKLGAIGDSIGSYYYARHNPYSATTTGAFHTYTINYHKNSAGVADDTFDVLFDGSAIMTGITRSEVYDHNQPINGISFGIGSSPGQGSMDVQYVRLTANGGTCGGGNFACNTSQDCGINGYSGAPFCQGGGVYQNYQTFTCQNPGTAQAQCVTHNDSQLRQTCALGLMCASGVCQNPVQPAQPGSFTVTKTVRNLTSGSGAFTSSTNANPGDTLLFMVSVQSYGSQIPTNILVRDMLPANLQYRGQLVVSGAANYAGDIPSGITLSSVQPGQTVTITYQTMVAPLENFPFGTTTLTNNVTVSSNNALTSPTGSASVMVTRGQVLGASSVSTGLTNNFWVDSIILPLLIAVAGVGMYRVGLFMPMEQWIDQKRKTQRSYKADKALRARVEEIQKLGKV